jgi:fluoroquinolone transport system permease protein
MLHLKSLRALGAFDAGSVLGDPLLRGMVLIPLAVALAVRLLLPLVVTRLSALAGVDLAWVETPLAGYAVVGIAPLLAGTVVGFLLLDQRDDRTLLALRVTPLPLATYLAYRLAAPTLAAIPLTVAALALASVAGLGPGEALVAALAAAPLAPLTALALLALARNKLEGMALMKSVASGAAVACRAGSHTNKLGRAGDLGTASRREPVALRAWRLGRAHTARRAARVAAAARAGRRMTLVSRVRRR